MIEYYNEKNGRRQWRIYCDTCHAPLGDTGPGKDHVPWGTDEICPKCNGKIHDPDAPKWSPKIHN
jgi:hypothetical protein